MTSHSPVAGVRAIDGLRSGRSATPPGAAIVIFGATGDLARRELIPALFELYCKGLLPEKFVVIGVAPRDWNTEVFREKMREAITETGPTSTARWDDFARRLQYVRGDAGSPADEGYAELKHAITSLCAETGIREHVLFHLAVPASLFGTIASRLGEAGLARSDDGWRRLIVEKPFGSDRASAAALDRELRRVFGEEQIYRVDHFLGKETVQNMLVFRFANPGFEPIWNHNYIDHVQITVAETLGIGTRATFYEQTGVVRDMIQNHLLQLLCMMAMEPPLRFDAISLRDETAKVLQAVNIDMLCREEAAVRGQYGPGTVGGERVPGYREEKGVDLASNTSTFAALKLTLDNWRWSGVPFYLRTGKRLSRKLTEVAIHFKQTPHLMFPAEAGHERHRSVLTFEVQPNEGIVLTLAAKHPGPSLAIDTVQMDFRYAEAFGVEQPPRAYAWLLHDALQGDQTLFARSDWIDNAWAIIDPVVEMWQANPPADFPNYRAGTAGPAAADALIERDGRSWRSLGSDRPPRQPRDYPDLVDETLDDSFPASDPPSWTAG